MTAPSWRILLVEDNPDTVHALARWLTKCGHTVIHAFGVAEALEVFAADSEIQVIICDIGLPDGDGLELLRTIRERSDVPAIAMSGYSTRSYIEKAREAGFQHYVVKPYRILDFNEILLNLGTQQFAECGAHA